MSNKTITFKAYTISDEVATEISSVYVSIYPKDINGDGGGLTSTVTPLTRTYAEGTEITLSASGFYTSKGFSKWNKDDAFYSVNSTIVITVSEDVEYDVYYIEPLYTSIYGMRTFQFGEKAYPPDDVARFRTIDSQMYALMYMLGNGVRTGWEVTQGTGIEVDVSAGNGHIFYTYAESTIVNTIEEYSDTNQTGLVKGAINYIYAEYQPSTPYDKAVVFGSSLSTPTSPYQILLATVTISADGTVFTIDNSVRNNISFLTSVLEQIAQHHHTGQTGQPAKIDLSSEVQGVLGASHIPDLDASKITTGQLDAGRAPRIDHTDLEHIGKMTHAEIDSYIESLSNQYNVLYGDLETTNLLQLFLSLKHIWSDVEKYTSNLLLFIPGISPDSFLDETNSTATIDKTEHQILGETAEEITETTTQKSWDTYGDMTGSDVQDNTNIDISAGGIATIHIPTDRILNFTGAQGTFISATQDWIKSDVSIDGGGTPPITITYFQELWSWEVPVAQQDWNVLSTESPYDTFQIVVRIGKRDGSYAHAGWYLYLCDENGDKIDTTETEVTALVTDYGSDTTRNYTVTLNLVDLGVTKVSKIVLYTNTIPVGTEVAGYPSLGWEQTGDEPDPNIITCKIYNQNYVNSEGTIRFRFGTTGDPFSWDKVGWSATIPEGTSIEARTRIGNSEAELNALGEDEGWSAWYTSSGDNIELYFSAVYQQIESLINDYTENAKGNVATFTLLDNVTDYVYLGSTTQFQVLSFYLSEAGQILPPDLEYWDGNEWQLLIKHEDTTIVTGETGTQYSMMQDGYITFELPAGDDWAVHAIGNDITEYYYVRMRTQSITKSPVFSRVLSGNLEGYHNKSKYIEAEYRLNADASFQSTPEVDIFYISYIASTGTSEIVIDQITEWNNGEMDNVELYPAYEYDLAGIVLKDSSKIGNYGYIENDIFYEIDSAGNPLRNYDGADLPLSPIQELTRQWFLENAIDWSAPSSSTGMNIFNSVWRYSVASSGTYDTVIYTGLGGGNANSASAELISSAGSDNAVYFGYTSTQGGLDLRGLFFHISTIGNYGTLHWEYSTGEDSWSTLTIDSDETADFTVEGYGAIRWTIPINWDKFTLGSDTIERYWIRVYADSVTDIAKISFSNFEIIKTLKIDPVGSIYRIGVLQGDMSAIMNDDNSYLTCYPGAGRILDISDRLRKITGVYVKTYNRTGHGVPPGGDGVDSEPVTIDNIYYNSTPSGYITTTYTDNTTGFSVDGWIDLPYHEVWNWAGQEFPAYDGDDDGGAPSGEYNGGGRSPDDCGYKLGIAFTVASGHIKNIQYVQIAEVAEDTDHICIQKQVSGTTIASWHNFTSDLSTAGLESSDYRAQLFSSSDKEDIIYIGANQKFSNLIFKFGVAGSISANAYILYPNCTYEYYASNGTWKTLNFSNITNPLLNLYTIAPTNSGYYRISFIPPTDWEATKINPNGSPESTDYYYMRIKGITSHASCVPHMVDTMEYYSNQSSINWFNMGYQEDVPLGIRVGIWKEGNTWHMWWTSHWGLSYNGVDDVNHLPVMIMRLFSPCGFKNITHKSFDIMNTSGLPNDTTYNHINTDLAVAIVSGTSYDEITFECPCDYFIIKYIKQSWSQTGSGDQYVSRTVNGVDYGGVYSAINFTATNDVYNWKLDSDGYPDVSSAYLFDLEKEAIFLGTVGVNPNQGTDIFLAGTPPSSGLNFVSNVTLLENGNYQIIDAGNQRILELDENSEVVDGWFSSQYGYSYLTNINDWNWDNISAWQENPVLINYYNENTGEIYVLFNNKVDNITLDLTKIVLSIGEGTNNSITLDATDDVEVINNQFVAVIYLSDAHTQTLASWTSDFYIIYNSGAFMMYTSRVYESVSNYTFIYNNQINAMPVYQQKLKILRYLMDSSYGNASWVDIKRLGTTSYLCSLDNTASIIGIDDGGNKFLGTRISDTDPVRFGGDSLGGLWIIDNTHFVIADSHRYAENDIISGMYSSSRCIQASLGDFKSNIFAFVGAWGTIVAPYIGLYHLNATSGSFDWAEGFPQTGLVSCLATYTEGNDVLFAYAGTRGDYIYGSDDGGLTYTKRDCMVAGGTIPSSNIVALACDITSTYPTAIKGKVVYCSCRPAGGLQSSNFGLYLSTDGCNNFNRIDFPEVGEGLTYYNKDVLSIACDTIDNTVIYVGTRKSGIWKLTLEENQNTGSPTSELATTPVQILDPTNTFDLSDLKISVLRIRQYSSTEITLFAIARNDWNVDAENPFPGNAGIYKIILNATTKEVITVYRLSDSPYLTDIRPATINGEYYLYLTNAGTNMYRFKNSDLVSNDSIVFDSTHLVATLSGINDFVFNNGNTAITVATNNGLYEIDPVSNNLNLVPVNDIGVEWTYTPQDSEVDSSIPRHICDVVVQGNYAYAIERVVGQPSYPYIEGYDRIVQIGDIGVGQSNFNVPRKSWGYGITPSPHSLQMVGTELVLITV